MLYERFSLTELTNRAEPYYERGNPQTPTSGDRYHRTLLPTLARGLCVIGRLNVSVPSVCLCIFMSIYVLSTK